jgi:tetratricopeptide (TPR) repeat protein
LCYGALILPMLGLVQQGHLYAAGDRFSYLACLGFAFLFGAAFVGAGRPARLAALLWLAVLGGASWRQCRAWKDTTTFWTWNFERAPGEISVSNMGGALFDEGRIVEARPYLERAVAEYPDSAMGYQTLGLVLQLTGDRAGAVNVWRRGLARCPTAEMEEHLGVLLASQGSRIALVQGVRLLEAAVTETALLAGWRADLADAYARAGLLPRAEREYRAAVSLDPGLGRAWNNWGLELTARGETSEAQARYRAALVDPGSRAQAHYNLGNLLLSLRRPGEAELHYRKALAIDPGLCEAQVNLGNILAQRGRYAEAAVRYRAALERRPDLAQARANLAAVGRLMDR